MIVIYILAVIGGLCVISTVGLGIMLFFYEKDDQCSEKRATCALTGQLCQYTDERQSCNGCPVAEEAERIGNR